MFGHVARQRSHRQLLPALAALHLAARAFAAEVLVHPRAVGRFQQEGSDLARHKDHDLRLRGVGFRRSTTV